MAIKLADWKYMGEEIHFFLVLVFYRSKSEITIINVTNLSSKMKNVLRGVRFYV